MPTFVEPALATLASEAPEGSDWLHELKFDGYRIQARLAKGQVRLLTRSGLDWTAKFQSVADALRRAKLPPSIIDGEIVVQDSAGRSDFAALQRALSESDQDAFAFFVFDLLYADGIDLRSLPLSERKARLSDVLARGRAVPRIQLSDHVTSRGADMVVHACRLGLEGIVSKRLDAPYRSGRRGDWIKTKCSARQELVVIGFVPSEAAPNAIGSLVMGLHERGRLVHVGRVGTGYTAAMARTLYRKLKPLVIDTAPAIGVLRPAARGVRWVTPRLVAEVEMRGWGSDGLLRHASFKGLREDKSQRDVVREVPRKP